MIVVRLGETVARASVERGPPCPALSTDLTAIAPAAPNPRKPVCTTGAFEAADAVPA